MEWRDLPKLQALPYAGCYCNLSGFLHSADATVGMTYRGVVSFCPHGFYSLRCLAMNHRRYIGFRIWGDTIHPHRLYSERSGRQIAVPTDVVPFTHTGYIHERSRNGTQAVPYGFADTSVFSTVVVKNGHFGGSHGLWSLFLFLI